MAFEEFSMVRLREAYTGRDVYCGGEEHHLPAGTQGAIVDVLWDGEAFEVDFQISLPQFDGDELLDAGESMVVTLRRDQLLPA